MLNSLQSGRAMAAMAVLAFHLSGIFGDPRVGMTPVLADYTSHGWLGVDFFFVLSGFIIIFVHRRDIHHPRRAPDYVLKRFIRVFPIYWLLTAVTLIGTKVTGGIKAMPENWADILSTVSLIHFTGFHPPVSVAWTLYHEVLFYAFFVLLIVHLRLGLLCMGAWLIAILLTFRITPHGEWSFMGTLLSATNISFFLGMGAYGIMQRIRSARSACILIGCALLAIPLIHMSEAKFGLSTTVQLSYSLALMLLIGGAAGLEQQGRTLKIVVLGLIGDASYTLYLAHESIASAILKIAKRLGILANVAPVAVYIAVFILTVALSVIGYKLVEAPLIAMVRAWFARRKGRSAIASEGAPKKVAD